MDCDKGKYYETEQVCGSPCLFFNNEMSKNFVEKWLFYCKNPAILTDIPNICSKTDLLEFKAHRHDQSVLSLLALKENISIQRDPSQYGNSHIAKYPLSDYGQLLDLHRRKHFSFWQKVGHKLDIYKKVYFRSFI